MAKAFVWQMRVYWEDTDAGGVIYHSRYLNFFERARTEWLRSLDIHQAELASEHDIVFAIRKIDIDFLMAGRMDDHLDVSVRTVSLGGSRMTLQQDIIRISDQVKLASAEVTAVCLKAGSFKPDRTPDWIKERIEGFINAD